MEVIGRGGHSFVYKARDRKSGGLVAVKMLHDRVAGEPEYAVRMTREQRAMASLEGTAAAQVYGLTTSPDGALCLVMELLEGVDLDDHLIEIEAEHRRAELGAVLDWLAPVVDTLEVAHEAGIVHRDLKPGNIFLLRDGGVRLLDFGLAKLTSSAPLTRRGTVMGSPSYIAPEVWAGAPEAIDHRVDIYSLGAIVFRALAGRVPFPGDTLKQKLDKVTGGKRPSLHELRPELPREVDDWVRQVLAVEPSGRFWRIRAMHAALLAALGVDAAG